MNITSQKALTEFHEGRVLHAYRDSLGFWTIAVGRLIDERKGAKLPDNILKRLDVDTQREFAALGGMPMSVKNRLKACISNEQADELYEQDLKVHNFELDEVLPWVKDLDEVRQAVLRDMYFNMRRKLLEFKHTLAFIRVGKWTDASSAMLRSKWAEQVGPRATRLANMMKSGQWPKG